MAGELPQFDLEKALHLGLLPLVLGVDDAQTALEAYVGLYLEQEVRAEGLTRNLSAYSRFLEAVSFSHGGQLNVSAVAREAEVERRTVANYMSILEDLLLAFRVPVFRRRAKRHTVAHDKLYLFDSGVFRSLRPKGPLDSPEEIDGHALEGLVAQHLRAWIAYSQQVANLFYWRTQSGTEVDFVVYGESGLQALEVKNAARVQPRDFRSLRTFCSDYPAAEAALLYRGTVRERVDGIWLLPVEAFLRQMRPGQPLLDPEGGLRNLPTDSKPLSRA